MAGNILRMQGHDSVHGLQTLKITYCFLVVGEIHSLGRNQLYDESKHRNMTRKLKSVGVFLKIISIYTTQVNCTFRARWLASSEVISQVLFTSEQPKKNKMAFVGIFSQIKLLFGPLVIQLVWYILKQLFTSVSVKVVDIYLHFGE